MILTITPYHRVERPVFALLNLECRLPSPTLLVVWSASSIDSQRRLIPSPIHLVRPWSLTFSSTRPETVISTVQIPLRLVKKQHCLNVRRQCEIQLQARREGTGRHRELERGWYWRDWDLWEWEERREIVSEWEERLILGGGQKLLFQGSLARCECNWLWWGQSVAVSVGAAIVLCQASAREQCRH